MGFSLQNNFAFDMFPSIVKVLEYVEEEGANSINKHQAIGILKYFESFDFVFYLQLMRHILGLTDTLSQALQRKDRDILEAISLVETTKRSLQDFRLNGFERILEKCSSFCEKNGIRMLNMEENYVSSRSRRQITNITNRHYYEVDCFNTVLDMQIQDFGDRFNEASTELIANMAALNPCDSFSQFDTSKLLKLSELYPYDFDGVERIALEIELNLYHASVKNDVRFVNLSTIGDLARMMVETRKHLSYPLVFRLLKLAFIACCNCNG